MIAYNEQELLYLYHLGSSIAYKLLLDEYKNKIVCSNKSDSRGIKIKLKFL